TPRRSSARAVLRARGCPRTVHTPTQVVDSDATSGWKVVDNRVDPPSRRTALFGLPEGAARDRGNRDRIKGTPPPGRSLRALLYPVATASRCRPRDARRDVTGIPVSVLPSGDRGRGPAGRHPLDGPLPARVGILPGSF